MSKEEIIQILQTNLNDLQLDHNVRTLGLFGSFVRGEEKTRSDVDILVAFTKTPGLFGYIALENHLSKLLGRKVDLVMQDALKSAIGRRILSEVVQI